MRLQRGQHLLATGLPAQPASNRPQSRLDGCWSMARHSACEMRPIVPKPHGMARVPFGLQLSALAPFTVSSCLTPPSYTTNVAPGANGGCLRLTMIQCAARSDACVPLTPNRQRWQPHVAWQPGHATPSGAWLHSVAQHAAHGQPVQLPALMEARPRPGKGLVATTRLRRSRPAADPWGAVSRSATTSTGSTSPRTTTGTWQQLAEPVD